MNVSDPKGETEEIIALISKIEQIDSISGLLGACYRRLHFLSREAMASGDTKKQNRAWNMATRIRQIIDIDGKGLDSDISTDPVPRVED